MRALVPFDNLSQIQHSDGCSRSASWPAGQPFVNGQAIVLHLSRSTMRPAACRLFLLANKIPFTNELVTFQDWGSSEKQKLIDEGTNPLGHLPVLIVGDKHMPETIAICRYAAREVRACLPAPCVSASSCAIDTTLHKDERASCELPARLPAPTNLPLRRAQGVRTPRGLAHLPLRRTQGVCASPCVAHLPRWCCRRARSWVGGGR
jgi:Glutathione S-transferase, N-terminal domain